MSARFKVLDPFLFIGVFDVVMDLRVEFLYLWVRRRRGAEGFSFKNESFGDFSEVKYHVRYVTLGDMVLCGGDQDLWNKGSLTRGAEGR